MKKFIRYRNHILFVSEDNWITFEPIERSSITGDEETDADKSSIVKLKYELGLKKAEIVVNEFKKIRKQFNLQEKDGFGHAFEVFAIANIYNIDYNVAYDKYIVKGAEDGKIDAIYWNDDSKNYIYQIKMDFLDLNDLQIAEKNYREYMYNNDITQSESSNLLEFCNYYSEKMTRDKDYEIITISNNNTNENNKKPIDIYNIFFENIIINRKSNIQLRLDVPQQNEIATLDDKNLIYAYFISANDFIKNLLNCDSIINKDNLYKFFYDNVRGNLGVNTEIEDTINDDPANFIKYNNGVTITGNVSYIKGSKSLKINEPIINNGQQTIMNLIAKYPCNNDVCLLIIVKNETDRKIKGKISRYTNTQRKIKPLDLLSLSEDLRSLQKQLFELPIEKNETFLEINSSGIRNYTNVIKKIYTKNNIISLIDFCKLYFSTDDNKLGNWKSNISIMIEPLLDKNINYDKNKALNVCSIISKYKKYISSIQDKNKQNILKGAGLAFMYIMYKYKLDEVATENIIGKINKEYYYDIPDDKRKSKIIDLYKSNTIVEKIDEMVEKARIEAKDKIKC